jgi:hypothetical protein
MVGLIALGAFTVFEVPDLLRSPRLWPAISVGVSHRLVLDQSVSHVSTPDASRFNLLFPLPIPQRYPEFRYSFRPWPAPGCKGDVSASRDCMYSSKFQIKSAFAIVAFHSKAGPCIAVGFNLLPGKGWTCNFCRRI